MVITLAMFGYNLVSAILCAINTALLMFQVLYGLILLKMVISYYRAAGLTAEAARNEAITAVAKSDVGRDLAAASLKSAAANNV